MFSTVGTELGTTRSFRYAKETQLDGAVSEDGVVVVLIHKQRLGACQAGGVVLFVAGEDVAGEMRGRRPAGAARLLDSWVGRRRGLGGFFSSHDGSLGVESGGWANLGGEC